MKKAAWICEAFFYFTLSIPFAVLPLSWTKNVGEILGLLVFFIWSSRRKIALENIRKSILFQAIITSRSPETIIQNTFKNMGRSLAEIIKIYYGFDKKIFKYIEIQGIENFHYARSKGKGILFLTGHCGNWELLSLTASVKLLPITIIARPINNPYVNKYIERMRQRYGNKVIYKKDAIRPIIKTLKNNGIVGILMDQAVLSDEGYVTDFLGRGAWTTKTPAIIARKTGAATLPVFIHRTKRGHRIKIYPEIMLSPTQDLKSAIIEDTKQFSSFIEKYIREYPDEWLWIHRRWKRV
jgi:KDO2-lipid IV(A) lauroyltransferase